MKLRTSLIAAVAALPMPFLAASPAYASADGLEPAGSSYFEYHSSTNSFLSDVVNSDGGYFKFCIHNTGGGSDQAISLKLKEYDASNADETIAVDSFYSGDCGTYYVGNYGDGTNGTPELYVESYVLWNTGMWVEYID